MYISLPARLLHYTAGSSELGLLDFPTFVYTNWFIWVYVLHLKSWFRVCWFCVWPTVSNSVGVGKVICVPIQGRLSSIVSCHIFCIHVCLFSSVCKASREVFLRLCSTLRLIALNMPEKFQILPQHSSFKPCFNVREHFQESFSTVNPHPTGCLQESCHTHYSPGMLFMHCRHLRLEYI